MVVWLIVLLVGINIDLNLFFEKILSLLLGLAGIVVVTRGSIAAPVLIN